MTTLIIESFVNGTKDTDFSISSDELMEIEKKAGAKVSSIKVYASTTNMSLKVMVNNKVASSALKATIEDIILLAYEQ